MDDFIASLNLPGNPDNHAYILAASAGAVMVMGMLMLFFRRPSNAPPTVKMGLPLVGNPMAFVKSPLGMIEKAHSTHGEAFTVPMGPQNLTFLIGPQAGAPFFTNRDDVLSQNEVYGFMKPVFGPGVVYDAEPSKRTAQMKTMSNGLKADALQSYIPKIEQETRDFLKKNWGDSGEVDLLTTLSELTILTASRCLHGDDVRENMFNEVANLYHDLDKGITPISFFLPNLPTKAHKIRNKARIEMCNLFSKVINSRRERMAAGEDLSKNTDMLQRFMEMQYRDGTAPSTQEITGLLIALLFAGQHTSSISSTWTTLLTCRDPAIWKGLQEEQDELVGDQPLTFEKVRDMEKLHNCMREALRMFPPLIMLMRMAKQPFAVTTSDKKTYVVPKGDIVITSPAVSMRLDRVFPEPDKFDPTRYNEPREEHKQPYAYLGFGAGMHQCMGQTFGFLQVKTIMSVLIREYDFELLSPNLPEPDYEAMVVGPKEDGSCKTRYTRRT